MTLTLYVAHVAVFNLVVHWLGWIRPTGLDVALLFAIGFWVVAIALPRPGSGASASARSSASTAPSAAETVRRRGSARALGAADLSPAQGAGTDQLAVVAEA